MASSSLNAARRSQELVRLAAGEDLDLLVIGGGITGTGVALDAASRGLSVALVERADLANGTSRWSSKLIHGGLRYLRQFEVGIAWESAQERQVLMRWTAPHLVRPLPFLVPFNTAVPPVLAGLTDLGIRVGDAMRIGSGLRRSLMPGPRRISAQEALQLAPGLGRSDLRGAELFWDGQAEDDARIVVAVARTAAAHGARILTRCRVAEVQRGRVDVEDLVGGQRLTLRPRHVVNAAGVWAGELDAQVGLTPSKGTHLILRASAVGDPRAAVLTPVPHESARWVGITPLGDGRVLLGVTDDAYQGGIDDEPAVTDGEREFLLRIASQALAGPIPESAVIGGFAGFRPLVHGSSGSTADLSRRHAIIDNSDLGMTTIVGGKFTTYRRMAEDTIDHVLRLMGEQPRRCVTRRLPLVGAATPQMLARLTDVPTRLVRRYGAEATAVAALARSDPALLEPVAEGVAALGVELAFGIRHELALNVSDLLDRRVRLGLVPDEREAALPAAEKLLPAGVAA